MKEELRNMSEESLDRLEDQLREDASSVEDILENLSRTKDGAVRQTISNCLYVLQHDPVLRGAICKNELNGKTVIVREMSWKRSGETYTDVDEDNLKLRLERMYSLTNEKKIRSAVNICSNENRFHPIRNLLKSLAWDGKERIRFALAHFFGAEANDYVAEVLLIHMLAAIRRVFSPGCKYDICLCLVGPQGCGKSSFFRLLAMQDEWFSDDLKKVDDENVYRKIEGHWIIEFSEISARTAARSIEDFKGFITRQKETYKVPYEKHPEDRLRQCVFCGTTNDIQFLPYDVSGNRRFAPIPIDPSRAERHILADEAYSREYIRQMWAEAMNYYMEYGNSLELVYSSGTEEYARRLQKEFMPEDCDLGLVEAFLEKKEGGRTCVKEIYCEVFNHLFSDSVPKAESIRITEMLRTLGWVCVGTRKFPTYGSQKAWEKKPDPAKDAGDGFVRLSENEQTPFDRQLPGCHQAAATRK